MSVPVFIHAYSLANALGGDRAAIARGLMAGDTGGMAAAPRWRKADRACWVGEIGGDLPAPESGADDSRCHRILLKATLPLLATLRAGLEGIRPDRIAVVDEPDQPAASWGSFTYRDMGERSRAIAAGLDALGIGVEGVDLCLLLVTAGVSSKP